MSKITLPDIASGYNLSAINSNFQKIEGILNDEVLYRKGYLGEPNEMQTNLDMNGKQILNLPNATQLSEPATYAQLLQVEAPGDSLLRNELAAPGGAGLVGGLAKPITSPEFAGGADYTGATSSKNALKAALESGGDIYIPDGNYFIPGEGPDAGGVLATITKSLSVVCSPRAKFFTDSLDNDLIRIEVPSDGVGVPAEGITVDWDGGFFDQRNQRNSTVMPFTTEYPPTKPGSSQTCDALSIRGWYSSGGVTKSAIKRATVRRVVTMAGNHWQSAGGDSGVFIDGIDEQSVTLCYFKGNRDLGAYPSADESGQLKCSVVVENNIFDSCFHGVSAKRGFESIQVAKNTFVNCVRAAQSELLTIRNRNFGVYNNTFISCGTSVRAIGTDGGAIWGNTDKNHGALLQNGSIEPIIGLKGYWIIDSTLIDVGPNKATAENPACAIAYPTQGQGVSVDGTSSGCVIYNNTFCGWRRLGADGTTAGKNRWKGNVAPDATAKTVAFTDIANGSEQRVADALGNAPWWRTPQYIFPTDETNPLIRGYSGSGSGTTGGIYFKGNDLGLAGNNVLIQGSLYPVTANSTLIGPPTSPLAGGNTQTAFTVTSDERVKTAPLDITDAMLDAASEVDLVRYQYLDRIEAKGPDGARWHFGAVAQRYVEAFSRHGLDAHRFGFICYDEWDDQHEPVMAFRENAETGEQEEYDTGEVKLVQSSGNRYGIRYEEVLVLEAALQRRNYQRLLSRVEALEATNG